MIGLQSCGGCFSFRVTSGGVERQHEGRVGRVSDRLADLRDVDGHNPVRRHRRERAYPTRATRVIRAVRSVVKIGLKVVDLNLDLLTSL